MPTPHIQTRFVEIDLPRSQLPNGQVIPATIEALLQAWGKPLRWAITHVDQNSLHIEATLTSTASMDQESETLPDVAKPPTSSQNL